MNTRAALNGAFHGLRSTRGKQSSFAHALLHGLEALVQEQSWHTAWSGGEDQRPACELCGQDWQAWTEVEWSRGEGHG